MEGPVLKVESGPSPTQRGVSETVSSGLSTLASAGSLAADMLPFDRDELFGVLHFRLFEAKEAQRPASWIGGRLFNRFSGAKPSYIPVSGAHLKQVLDQVRIETPDFVVAGGKYLLRFDYAERVYERLEGEREMEAS